MADGLTLVGILVEMTNGLCIAFLVGPDGNVTMGSQYVNGSNWQKLSLIQRDMPVVSSSSTLKVLARRSMLESYAAKVTVSGFVKLT